MKVYDTSDLPNHIKYGFKHPDTVPDYERAVFNEYKERKLRDISTDCFIQNMFSDTRQENEENKAREKKRFYFLAYVYTYLNLILKTELPKLLANENILLRQSERIILLFKGGNMMFQKYEGLIKGLNEHLRMTIRNKFDDYFKVSDFDFTLYITVQDRKTFYRVKQIANKVLWNGVSKIRDFFEKYLEGVMDNIDVNNLYTYIIGENTIVDDTFLQRVLHLHEDFSRGPITILTIVNHYEVLSKYLQYISQKTETTRLSKTFEEDFSNRIEILRKGVLSTWIKTIKPACQKYIDKYIACQCNIIKFVAQDYVNNTNVPVFTQVLCELHKYLVLLSRNTDVIDSSIENDIEHAQETINVILTTIRYEFAKQIKVKIIESEFYTQDGLEKIKTDIINNIKKEPFSITKAIYNEYSKFNGDVSRLLDKNNFRMIDFDPSDELDITEGKRKDFLTNTDLIDDDETLNNATQQKYHYMYQNSTISKIRNQHTSIVDFDLLRVKFNYVLKRKSDSLELNVPSEFIDISICGYDDTALTHFRNHYTGSIEIYIIENEGFKLHCLGYTTSSITHDLIYVLYEQNLFTPWTDPKYEKRMYRMICLEMLPMLQNVRDARKYIMFLYFMHHVITNSLTYVQNGKLKDEFVQIYKNMTENITNNYEKYDFRKVTYSLPSSLMTTVMDDVTLNITALRDDLEQEVSQNRESSESHSMQIDYLAALLDINMKSIPYPDEIIGSIVFYSLMLRKQLDATNQNKDAIDEITKIINKYRKDFLYLPMSPEDIKDTLKKSENYLVNITKIYTSAFSFAYDAMMSGGKHVSPSKINYQNTSTKQETKHKSDNKIHYFF